MPAMPAPLRHRPLSFLQLRVKAPLGFLYFLFLAILSVPVMIGMTLLWYVSRGAGAFAGLFRGRQRGDTEERAA